MVFHGEDRMDEHTPSSHLHETPAVVTVPLDHCWPSPRSVIGGIHVVGPVIFGGFFGNSIVVHPEAHDVLAQLGEALPRASGLS